MKEWRTLLKHLFATDYLLELSSGFFVVAFKVGLPLFLKHITDYVPLLAYILHGVIKSESFSGALLSLKRERVRPAIRARVKAIVTLMFKSQRGFMKSTKSEFSLSVIRGGLGAIACGLRKS